MKCVGGNDARRRILKISLAPLWLLNAAVTWQDADLWTWPTESAGSGAATVGRWSDPRLLPTAPGNPPETLNPVHGVLVPQGRKGDILWFRNTRTFVFDLDDPGSIEAMDYPDGPGDHQLFCCAQVPLESGDVLLVGGNYWEGVSPCTVATAGWASLYDRETQLITRIADIPFGQPLISDPGTTSFLRYYPTATRLPNGHILVTGGDCWDDINDNCQIDGSSETIFQKDHGVYVPGTGWIPDEAESILDNTVNYDAWNDMPYYPRYHVVPCGLFFGGQVGTGGQVSEVWPWGGTSKINNTRVEGYRGEGACIVASLGPGATDPVRIVYAGGGGGTAAEPQLTNAERITYTYSGGAWSSTGWSATGAMQSTVGGNPGGRFRADGVLLPDGQVLIVGGTHDIVGTSEPVHVPNHGCEVFDWATSAWTLVAPVANDRMYHSQTFLLPDGRVVTAGNEAPHQGELDPDGRTYEVYYPPYLFDGSGNFRARPRIEAWPDTLHYGYNALVVLDPSTGLDADDVDEVFLMAPAAMTHAANMNERRVLLDFVRYHADTLVIQGPPDWYMAPKGSYMLGVLADGVPSVMEFLWVTDEGLSRVASGTKLIWAGECRIDRDILVEEGGVLQVEPGTVATFVSDTDKAPSPAGRYADRAEIILQGDGKVLGTLSDRVTFTTTGGTAGGWGGFLVDQLAELVGASPAYGYATASEILHADIEDAREGITIRQNGAPAIVGVAFADITGNRHIYIDSTDVYVPYPTAAQNASLGGFTWQLDAPTNVVVANGVRPGADIGALTTPVNPGKADIRFDGKVRTTGGAQRVVFRPETIPAGIPPGDLWGGLRTEWLLGQGSVLEYADVGYAIIPVILAYQDSLTTVRHCGIHHFKDIGIWVRGAYGDGVKVENNFVRRDSTGALLDPAHGRDGIVIEQSVALISGNTVLLQGMQSATGGAALRISNTKSYCQSGTATPESLTVVNNELLGPGGGADTQGGLWDGLQADWACSALERKTYIAGNRICGWNAAGMRFTESSDVQVNCNRVDYVVDGIDFARTTSATGAGVRFRNNEVQTGAYAATDQVVLRTDEAVKLQVGPGSALTKGKNRFVARGQDWYAYENDGNNTHVLDASRNYWKRDIWQHADPDSIALYITKEGWASGSVLYDVSSPEPSGFTIVCLPDACAADGGAGAGTLPSQGHPATLDDEPARDAAAIAPLGPHPLTTGFQPFFSHPVRGPVEVAFGVAPSDEGPVVVEVFDVAGRRVQRLVDQDLAAGRYRVTWNGGGAAPGVYFVRLSAGSHREVRKLVRLDR